MKMNSTRIKNHIRNWRSIKVSKSLNTCFNEYFNLSLPTWNTKLASDCTGKLYDHKTLNPRVLITDNFSLKFFENYLKNIVLRTILKLPNQLKVSYKICKIFKFNLTHFVE